MDDRDRVIRGLYLLQAELLKALALNRPPDSRIGGELPPPLVCD